MPSGRERRRLARKSSKRASLRRAPKAVPKLLPSKLPTVGRPKGSRVLQDSSACRLNAPPGPC
eukprot:12995603-Alexandrium_andersonii.AAC.1